MEEREIYEAYLEMRSEAMMKALRNIKDGIEHQPWRVVSLKRIQKIWGDFSDTGFVRNEAGLEKIRAIVVENIIKIDINTSLCGHSSFLPLDEMKEEGVTDAMLEETTYFETDGSWRISDCALRPLLSCLFNLIGETSSKHTLLIIDRVLSISHQRSDLASWFVDGGVYGLNLLGGFKDEG